MQALSYNISPVQQQALRQIELARQAIVLHPLSPKVEHRLKWNAHITRLYYSLHLAHNPISKKEIISSLTFTNKKSTMEVIQYKRALDYIAYEWLVNDKPIMPQTIAHICQLVNGKKTTTNEPQMMEILVFLQTSSENPFIRAFVAYLQFASLLATDDPSGKVARLIPYLFLYKEGYDFRGLLVLEEYFYTNERLLKEIEEVIKKNESISPWIEHFCQWVVEAIPAIERTLKEEQESIIPHAFFDLTERQKSILSLFDQPGLRITNKKIQQAFAISQITASRDLARLSTLGLLLPQGKGRSVYYVKV